MSNLMPIMVFGGGNAYINPDEVVAITYAFSRGLENYSNVVLRNGEKVHAYGSPDYVAERIQSATLRKDGQNA